MKDLLYVMCVVTARSFHTLGSPIAHHRVLFILPHQQKSLFRLRKTGHLSQISTALHLLIQNSNMISCNHLTDKVPLSVINLPFRLSKHLSDVHTSLSKYQASLPSFTTFLCSLSLPKVSLSLLCRGHKKHRDD